MALAKKKPLAKVAAKAAAKKPAPKMAPKLVAPKNIAKAKPAPKAVAKAPVKPPVKVEPKAMPAKVLQKVIGPKNNTVTTGGRTIVKPVLPVNKEKENALREAAKIAESLSTKVDKPITSIERKKDLTPIDPKEAAKAIKQIKASFFSSLGGGSTSAPTSVTSSANSPFPPRIQALVDKQEIGDLMVTYARGIDRSEENLVRSVFHPDASVDFGPGIFQGSVSEFIAWALDVRSHMKATQHMVTNVRVDLRGDTALCETYFMNWHRLDKSTGKEDFFVGGRYLDKLERRPGGASGVWKIAHRKQVKDWTRTTPVAELFYHLNPDALWAHHSRNDLSYSIENFPTGNNAKAPAFLGKRYDAKSMKV